jgi:hypothetical protein
MVGGSGFQPRFTRAIAVKNRSHNPKTTDTKLQSFFIDYTGRFSGQRRRLYETSRGQNCEPQDFEGWCRFAQSF